MAQTKIKSHRIADEAIQEKHLHKGLRVPESLLGLRYPTHSNAGDLSPAQKFTLTQGGNADGLHFHNGGGGGPEGIYTNEERDAQILKLAMMMNANMFGLDKAIKENFEDPGSIDFGYMQAQPPKLTLLANDPVHGGDLEHDKDYTYGASFKSKYGQTNIVNISSIHTDPNYTDQAVKVNVTGIPLDNEGVELYRCSGVMERYLNDVAKEKWYNPHNVALDFSSLDATSTLTSVTATYSSYPDIALRQQYVDQECDQPSVLLSLGESMRTVVAKDAPFEYYLNVESSKEAHTLEIIWHFNPTYVPVDYEVMYTESHIINDTTVWKKFDKLTPFMTDFNTRLNDATDGDIIDNHRIVGNTKSENKFTIAPTPNIRTIRIVVTKVHTLCHLNYVRLSEAWHSYRKPLYFDLDGIDFTPYNLLKADFKHTHSVGGFDIELVEKTERVSNTRNYYSSSLTSGYYQWRDYQARCFVNLDRNTSTLNINSWNRVRIAFNLRGSDLRLENFYLHFYDQSVTQASSCVNSEAQIPLFTIPITFNGGDHFIESTATGMLWSDWCYLPTCSKNVNVAMVAYKHVRGEIGCYNSGTYEYLSMSNALADQGRENTSIVHSNSASYSYSSVNIQLGLAENRLSYLSSGMLRGYWDKNYLDLQGISTLKGIRLIQRDQITNSTGFSICNLAATRDMDLLNGTVATTVEMTTGATQGRTAWGRYATSTQRNYVNFNQYASVSAPQIVSYKFNEPKRIGQINILEDAKASAFRNYVLQYAIDENAKFDDDLSSPDWFNFQHMTLGDPGIDIGFTGRIYESHITGMNVYGRQVSHRFDAVDAVKVRVYVMSTQDGGLPQIYNIDIIESIDATDMELIYDSNGKVNRTELEYIDTNNHSVTPTPMPEINTSGSYNVIWDDYYDKVTKLLKDQPAVLYMRDIPLTLFEDIMLCVQTRGECLFDVSFDGGYTFDRVTTDKVHAIGKQVSSVVFKVTFNSEDAEIHALAMLYSL